MGRKVRRTKQKQYMNSLKPIGIQHEKPQY